MECSLIKRKLSAFLDNELSNEEKHEILTHLQYCNDCQKNLEKLSQISDSLNLMEEMELSPYFMTRLKGKITENETKRIVLLPFWKWERRIVVPVGVLLLFIFSFLIGNDIGARLNKQSLQVSKEFNNFFGVTALNDLPDYSVGNTYVYLSTKEEAEK